jgi:hypothetical protein
VRGQKRDWSVRGCAVECALGIEASGQFPTRTLLGRWRRHRTGDRLLDKRMTKVIYEIPFNRRFYKLPEQDIKALLADVTGSNGAP